MSVSDRLTLLHAHYMLLEPGDIRYTLFFAIIAFSILDLATTQQILSASDNHVEGNPLIAPFIMTWWAWPVRLGIPLIVAIRDFRRGNYELMLFGATLYAMVVLYNFQIHEGWYLV